MIKYPPLTYKMRLEYQEEDNELLQRQQTVMF